MTSPTFVRTPAQVSGPLTHDERRRLDAHIQRWVDNAMSTEPVDREQLTLAIRKLYQTAGLPEPRIAVVSSPIVMALAGAFAAVIYWLRENKPTEHPTRDSDQAMRSMRTGVTCIGDNQYYGLDAVIPSDDDDSLGSAVHDAIRRVIQIHDSPGVSRAISRAISAVTTDPMSDASKRALDKMVPTKGDLSERSGIAAEVTETFSTKNTFEYINSAITRVTRDLKPGRPLDDRASDETRGPSLDTVAAISRASDIHLQLRTQVRVDEKLRPGNSDDLVRSVLARLLWDKPGLPEVQDLITELVAEHGGSQELFGAAARRWWELYQGGNMWPAWDCYVSAFRDVLGLRLPEYERFAAWEACSLNGGFRMVHSKFCIVSDRPELMAVDSQNRPHSATGPAYLWRDGWALWFWHGVQVDRHVIEQPEKITLDEIRKQENTEVRRVLIERYGYDRYCRDGKLLLVQECPANHPLVGLRTARLWRDGDTVTLIDLLNSTPEPDGTVRRYVLAVDPSAYGGRAGWQCLAAAASMWRDPADLSRLFFAVPEDYAPFVET